MGISQSEKKSVVALLLPAVFTVLPFTCCENGVAGMSSVDVGVGVSYDFSDKKYGNPSPQKNDDGAETSKKSDQTDSPKHEQGNDTALVTRFHYIYTYNKNDTFELFVAPSLHYDFSDDEKEASLQYNDVRGSFFKNITDKWSVFGENTFSLTENGDKKGVGEQNSEEEVAAEGGAEGIAEEASSADADPAAPPSLDEENDDVLYYRNHTALNARYLYGQNNSLQFGVSYDLLREDAGSVDLQVNDYDRYTVQAENSHRFNSSWGTTLRGSYVRGKYKEQIVVLPPVENPEYDEEAEAEGTSTEPPMLEEIEKRINNDVTEYYFSGSIINFFDAENVFSLEYNHIGVVYDGKERDNSTIYKGQLHWQHRFSEMLTGSLRGGPAWKKIDGGDSYFGLNGSAELRYLQKLWSYGLQISKIYDVENFDGTDKRGPVERLKYSLNADCQLSKRLSLQGLLGYTKEQGDELFIERSEDAREAVTSTKEYEKKSWEASLGLRYYLLEEVNAGLRYSFSHLDAEEEEDSYDEHKVMMTLDWAREWLRW